MRPIPLGFIFLTPPFCCFPVLLVDKKARERAERWHQENEAKWNRREKDDDDRRNQLEKEREARETIASIPPMTSNDVLEN